MTFKSARPKPVMAKSTITVSEPRYLKDLGVKKIRLLTNHPPKINALEAFGLEIVETI